MECTLPPEITAYLESPEFKAKKREADEWSDLLDRLTAPIVAGTAGRWRLLELPMARPPGWPPRRKWQNSAGPLNPPAGAWPTTST